MNVEQLQNADTGAAPEVTTADQLETLKARAKVMGITFHPAIGVEALRAKISAKLNDQPDPDEAIAATTAPAIDLAKSEAPVTESVGARRTRLRREASEMVRIVVSCKNPAKKEHAGEIFTTGNGVVGTFKKFVPFENENGWHVPRIIYNMIKNRECQVFIDKTVTIAGREQKVRTGKIIKEFVVEVLPPLTPAELKELAQRQMMASGVTA